MKPGPKHPEQKMSVRFGESNSSWYSEAIYLICTGARNSAFRAFGAKTICLLMLTRVIFLSCYKTGLHDDGYLEHLRLAAVCVVCAEMLFVPNAAG